MSTPEKDKVRRKSLLATLAFDAVATLAVLRGELESVHGIPASADLVRADLTWLDEMGLCRWNGDLAKITERGRDVVAGRAKFPGE